MREEDDGKAASGWEGARTLTRLSGVVMGGGFFGPAPPLNTPPVTITEDGGGKMDIVM